MKARDFVLQYYPEAKRCENECGLCADFILSQAAIESGWGKHCPGNNFFGIKADKKWEGERQLLTTTEWHDTWNVPYSEDQLLSITEINGKFKYRIKDWFRAYDTPAESFLDHSQFFFRNPRYKKALEVKHDPFKFAEEIAKAGYATDPLYLKLLISVIKMVQKIIKEISNV